MQPEVAEFMQLIMERLGVHSPRELARALGMVSADNERLIYRWVSGESAPSFYHMLHLLSASGMLSEDVAGWYHKAALS